LTVQHSYHSSVQSVPCCSQASCSINTSSIMKKKLGH